MKNFMLRVFNVAGMATADENVWKADLTVLADVIARNREIAGLHYPADSAGGARLADLLDGMLTATVAPMLDATIAAAANEWQP